MTQDRLQIADCGFKTNSEGLFIKIPGDDTSWTSFSDQFSAQVWIFISLSSLFCGLCLSIFQKRLKFLQYLPNAVWNVFVSNLGKDNISIDKKWQLVVFLGAQIGLVFQLTYIFKVFNVKCSSFKDPITVVPTCFYLTLLTKYYV